jgi:predicted GIY-YIG superfamily endonuclease
MSYIYVLKLQHGKYYVGKTNNPERRLTEHIYGKGSEYTKVYPPLKQIELREIKSEFDEDSCTKEYMAKYGIDNVRGGSYCTLELTEEQQDFLQREICHAKDKCFKCGGDHFAKDCTSFKNSSTHVKKSHNKNADRAFQLWSYKEEDRMIDYLNQGRSISSIAKSLGRTENAIMARMDLIVSDGEDSDDEDSEEEDSEEDEYY